MPGPFVYTCMKLREEVYFMALSFQFYDFTAHISYHCPGDNILCWQFVWVHMFVMEGDFD